MAEGIRIKAAATVAKAKLHYSARLRGIKGKRLPLGLGLHLNAYASQDQVRVGVCNSYAKNCVQIANC